MRAITVKNLQLIFLAGQISEGDDRQQALEVIDLINETMKRVGVQILSSHIDNSDIESEEDANT